MPTADRYAKYRSDQTTIWVSKTAATQLSREREAGESASAVLDRMMNELKRLRKDAGIQAPAPRAAKSAAKGASKAAAKSSAQGATKRATKTAAKGAAKSAGRGAAGKSAGKSAGKAAGRGARKSA